MDAITQQYEKAVIQAVPENNDFAYHRIEIEAEDRYAIDLWKDGAIARGRRGYRLKENTNPGIEIAIEGGEGLEAVRERIEPGRSSETSHYADLGELEPETLADASEVIIEYMEEAGEPEAARDAVRSFFSDIDSGLLD